MNFLSSNGAGMMVLAVQALFAWALWSLRRAFVRQDDYLLHVRRDARREAVMARRLDALEARLLNLPGNSDLTALRDEMAALRGGMQALNARMSGLDRLLERLERGMERQEDRFCLVSAAGRQTLTAQAPGGVR